ncbi:uncharacterized protein B0H64DRAFT_98871 [Chaetomium fimeti]|uniref:Uncharacterized protein n=1 Tax=Chaetomium fimeti TaxID=1854472 RepID=A0AAE0HML6_9PEZI|nr:hypothetical protein B0H64DRAFT_98871 [Chaetomium fimeti]
MRPLHPSPLQFHSLARILRPPTPRRPLQNPLRKTRQRQPYSSNPPPNPRSPNPQSSPPKQNPTTTPTTTRLDRVLSRLPRRLQPYAARLRGAPATHVVAFLLLHELTAVVPLLGLFALFHYTEHVPVAWMVAHYGGYVREGVGRFERWFRRRGLFGFGSVEKEEGGGGGEGGVGADAVLSRWEADPKYRVLVEVGLAYALTKVLLPVRIVGSVWATPWFAGVLGRLRSAFRRG